MPEHRKLGLRGFSRKEGDRLMLGQLISNCIQMCGMTGQDLADCIRMMLGSK